MNKWTISTLDAAPAMTRTAKPFEGTYEQAKMAAVNKWLSDPKSNPAVCSATDCLYWYYRINAKGEWSDRNKVPTVHGKLSEALLD